VHKLEPDEEPMRQRRVGLLLASLAFLLAGCRLFPPVPREPPAPRLADREAIARCLPHCATSASPAAVRLDTPLRWNVPEETVEAALAKVGARLGADGKLYSAAGKEIYFDCVGSGGTAPPTMTEEQREAAARARRELETRYTIITIVFFTC
jgi:hypothetical protein